MLYSEVAKVSNAKGKWWIEKGAAGLGWIRAVFLFLLFFTEYSTGFVSEYFFPRFA